MYCILEKVIEVEIASGVNKGNCVLIPRITIAPSDTELPFTLKRQQFPVRPCFAMLTNKAQGQTLDFVGIYLPDHVFTHGQLYVAFSRVCNSKAVAVHLGNNRSYTKNIVYKEVLSQSLIISLHYNPKCYVHVKLVYKI